MCEVPLAEQVSEAEVRLDQAVAVGDRAAGLGYGQGDQAAVRQAR